jgi:hemerythrin-like domain-containing protein
MDLGGKGMKDVIGSLLREHDHMRKMLDVFDGQLAIFEKAEQPDYDILSDSLAYCKDYLDVWHHPREDRLLALLHDRDPQKAESLSVLEGQHRDLAESTRRVVRIFRDVAERGAVHLREDLVHSGRDLSCAYRHHIRWEEANFFPAVESALSADDWEIARCEMARAAPTTDPEAVRGRYLALFRAIEAVS